MILLHSITDGIYLHSWCKILNSVHETLKPDPCPQTETVKTEACEPPIFLFSPTLHSTSDFSSVNKHRGVLCVSLSGQYMLLYICLLAAAVGSGRPRPKGFPQHPGTSCLAGAAPVVEMEEAYAQTRATGTWDRGCFGDLKLGCTGLLWNLAHLSFLSACCVDSAWLMFFEAFLKTVKSTSAFSWRSCQGLLNYL